MTAMLDPNSGEFSAEALRNLQRSRVVSLAFISGVLLFGGVMLFIQQGKLTDQLGLISIMGLVGAVVCVIVSWVMPPQIAPLFPAESPAQTWFLQTLMGMAILEGAAISNLMAVMMEHCQYSLAAAGFLVVVMVLRFPTAARFRTWLQLRQQDSGLT
ncbi:MAG: hypothetical protein RLZZ436_760 [Planctomycetota bacterium]|jgi:fucose permease